ncbi:class A beta-lactamase-related serine hydrolase [Bremerella cremea]|uniref:Class A beta-lactamase-related serine hydrolase n=1 Tax=Bremerella cremea TaxID=1031537 RepID=A0A368KSV3_9BACT|nr:serine hydrolase domain-containing protein [Bremerella cremea]RCS52648.1 class A beta-lactamase-related serine hydrolase [Bremerella cremea]
MLASPWTLSRVLTVLLCLAVACPALAQEKRRKPPAIESVNEAVAKHINDNDVAGAVTLVIEDGKVVHLSGLGKANLKADKPMRPGAMFAIASMTKPITATALMTLVEEGKVGLDDPVSKYIPEFAEVKLDGKLLDKPITVRQCLTHTAGLGGSQRVVGSLESTAKEIAQRPLRYEPGTKWEYSPGLNVVGRVIEVASGKPYGEFLQERILDPLKMNATTFHPNEKQKSRIATLYAKDKDSGELTEADSWIGNFETDPYPNPSAGLYSTARDLSKFYNMMLNGGFLGDAKILSRDSVKELTKLQTGDIVTGFTPGNGWGLGYCVVQEPQGVTESLSKGSFGHGGAFGTQSWGDPEKKRAYILLVQRSNFPNSDASELRKDFQNAAAAALNK